MIIDFKQIKNAITENVPFEYDIDLREYEHLGEHIFKNPIKIKGNVTNHLGIIKLTAFVQTTIDTVCGRCLKHVTPEFSFDVENILSATEEDGSHEAFVITGDKLDLDEILIPAIMLEVPMSSLCDEECKGLCPKCGTDLNAEKCSCDSRIIDPRLAVLQALLDK